MLQRILQLKPNVRSLKTVSRYAYSSQAVTKQAIPEETSDIATFKVGEKIHGFSVKDIQKISEFNVTAICLLHDATKAEYLHLYRNDNNNVFSVNFRTTPMDSTGLPHILEHTVLCGSQLYPVRDPFFKMLNRSLATFMNAMTGSDFTMYPFSTQNYSDYRNLQKIYLDAAFRPNLNQTDFMQEGWRLENVDPKDKNTDLIIKGVVYNEMKGAFSENESILQQKLQNVILPDHTYGVCSGGDPLKIPDLTWEALKQFHKDHYHPSNCRIYSYGNFPLIPTLEYVNSEYLRKFEYQNPKHTVVPSQARWDKPKKEHVLCRFENMREPFEQQNSLTIAYLMNDITDIYETFLLQFVTELLIKGPNAPFYKSLIEPNISGGFTPSTGFDSQQRDTIFALGLQGLKVENFEKIEKLFDETIDSVIASGFQEQHIESVLHRYELGLKHESANFGLNLLFGLTPTWNHNGDLIMQLRCNDLIDKLKNQMKANPSYLQNVVKKYFKDNNHRLVLTMSPDKEYEQKQVNAEKELISSKVKPLSDQNKEEIFKKCLQLSEEQAKIDNTSILPTLSMNDISSEVPRVMKDKKKVGPVPTQVFKVDTNGITYFRGILSTSQLSPEQQMMLPLLSYVITKLGTDSLNYRDFDSLVNRKTAGLGVQTHIGDSLYQLHSYEPGLLISSYCLNHNIDYMWDLWSQIFNLSELKDVARFEMLVKLYMSNLTHGVADSGHLYAMLAAQGLVSGVAYQKDLLTGLEHISYMKRLVKTSNFTAILTELTNVAKILFDKNNLRCSLNILPENDLQSFEDFVNKLPGNSMNQAESAYTTTKIWAPTDSVNCHHHVLNVPVNYCSKSILTVPYTHQDYSKLQVLSKLCTSKFLHPELREKQGAYGGGLKLSMDGVLSFYSYRDPQNTQTLDTFDNTAKWLTDNLSNITEQEVLEAKLGVFQGVDSPVPPGAKGLNEFLYGLDTDILQRHRAALMAVNIEGLKQVTENYLINCDISKTGKVVLGPKNMDTTDRAEELWTVVENE